MNRIIYVDAYLISLFVKDQFVTEYFRMYDIKKRIDSILFHLMAKDNTFKVQNMQVS